MLVPKTLVGAEVLPESADTVNVKQQDGSYRRRKCTEITPKIFLLVIGLEEVRSD